MQTYAEISKENDKKDKTEFVTQLKSIIAFAWVAI